MHTHMCAYTHPNYTTTLCKKLVCTLVHPGRQITHAQATDFQNQTVHCCRAMHFFLCVYILQYFHKHLRTNTFLAYIHKYIYAIHLLWKYQLYMYLSVRRCPPTFAPLTRRLPPSRQKRTITLQTTQVHMPCS